MEYYTSGEGSVLQGNENNVSDKAEECCGREDVYSEMIEQTSAGIVLVIVREKA